jgi:hypothetical protein
MVEEAEASAAAEETLVAALGNVWDDKYDEALKSSKILELEKTMKDIGKLAPWVNEKVQSALDIARGRVGRKASGRGTHSYLQGELAEVLSLARDKIPRPAPEFYSDDEVAEKAAADEAQFNERMAAADAEISRKARLAEEEVAAEQARIEALGSLDTVNIDKAEEGGWGGLFAVATKIGELAPTVNGEINEMISMARNGGLGDLGDPNTRNTFRDELKAVLARVLPSQAGEQAPADDRLTAADIQKGQTLFEEDWPIVQKYWGEGLGWDVDSQVTELVLIGEADEDERIDYILKTIDDAREWADSHVVGYATEHDGEPPPAIA